RELPHQRPEPVTQVTDAVDEVVDLCASAGKFARGDDALGRLGRKHETLRRRIAPAGIYGGLLRAVVGAVDLDAGQLATGEFKLAALHQPGWIEHAAAPRGVDPAADADVDAGSGGSGCEQIVQGKACRGRSGLGRDARNVTAS